MCAAFNISLQLSDFTSSIIYVEAESSEKSVDAVQKWLAGSQQAEHSPWPGIFAAVSSSSSGSVQKNPSLLFKLSKVLAKILESSQETLLENGQNAGGAVLSPAAEAAAGNALKLSLFFLCHLAKATTSSWQIRKECSQALVSVEVGLLEAAERRAAELLLLTTMLEILVAAGSSASLDASTKAAAVATKSKVIGFLAVLLCQENAAAPRALDALFSLIEQPKQKESVLKDAASVLLSVMERSEMAGCSIVAAALARACKNNTSAADNLACILCSLAASTHPAGTPLRASLMACPKELCLLLQHSRPGVKKAALDIVAILGFGCSDGGVVTDVWSQIAIAAVLNLLREQDATLRAKALSLLENYAEEAVAAVALSGEANLKSFEISLSDSLIDRSVSVRKKAVAALVAVVAAATTQSAENDLLLPALQANTLTTVCNLLQLSRDSKLYPGEAAATTLCATFIALAQPSESPAGALSLLCLHRSTPDTVARLKLQTAFAESCLPSSASSDSSGTLLEALLGSCTTQEVDEMRSILHLPAAGNHTFAARMQAELRRVAENISKLMDNYNEESMQRLAKMIYVLGPSAASQKVAAEEEFVWLLNLTQSIAARNQCSNSQSHALYSFLRSLKLWIEQLGIDSRRKQATRLSALVISVSACQSPDLTKCSLALLHSLPNTGEALNSVLTYFAREAGISVGKEESTSVSVSVEKKASACLAFLSTLAAMAELYKQEKSEFLVSLKQQKQNLPRGGVDVVEEEEKEDCGGEAAMMSDADGVTDFCLEAEGENSSDLLAAAQKYLDDLLEAQDTAPAAFLPALLELASLEGENFEDGKQNRYFIQCEALKVLEALACLSQLLAEKCISQVTSLLQPSLLASGQTSTMVTVQAIKFFKAVIQAFPAAYGSLITSFTPFLDLPGSTGNTSTSAALLGSPAPVSSNAIISIAAAGSFSELVLSNKIKVYECLGALGSGLASSIPTVAEISALVLRQLLAGSTAPGDRAAFVLGVSQQTPLNKRRAATVEAWKFLPEIDQYGDALVGPCIAAALHACQPAADLGVAGSVGLQVVLEMMRVLHPSVKMLKMLLKGLQSSTSHNNPGSVTRETMPRALQKELEEFVKRAAGASDASEFLNNSGDGDNGDDPRSGKKRGRSTATAAKATSVKKLQQDIFGLLAAKKGKKVPQQHR